MNENTKSFPKDFIWGVSSAAYQIEGAAREDGKGLSVWDDFCTRKGAIWNGHTGNVACDHYHRYKEDVQLLKNLGVGAYRLSMSWPRIIPNGIGKINSKGIDFYNRLIDSLLKYGIEPHLTLYHWDMPLALSKKKGWLNPDSVKWFSEYTQLAVNKFSDRVQYWYPVNEPQCIISLGYYQGIHAPGLKLPLRQALQAGHHLLMANGSAVKIIRSDNKQKVKIGFSVASQIKIPASQKPEDIAAAKKVMFGVQPGNLWNNSWWMDPVYFGKYPAEGLKAYAKDLPEIGPNDMKLIQQPLDFCCVNVYTAKRYRSENGKPLEVAPKPGYNMTSQEEWEVVPESIYWTTKWMHERYKLPVVVTENGHQNLDSVSLDGKVHDPQRIDYLHRHLLQLRKAMKEGVPVNGYFVWTLMDNFEWSFGYKVRVGLVHTDYETLKRTPKDSYLWYKKVVRNNGGSL